MEHEYIIEVANGPLPVMVFVRRRNLVDDSGDTLKALRRSSPNMSSSLVGQKLRVCVM